MREIPLTKGMTTIVDDEDYEKLSKYTWRYTNGYAATGIEAVGMHRMIMDAPESITVDHRDGNKLNNRRYNLRLATQRENCSNRGKRIDNKSSNFKGVHCRRNRWHVQLNDVYRGSFTSEIAAANCYNYYAKQEHGEFAKLNDVDYMDYETWNSYKTRRGQR